ncbi:MAG: hypothetical protein AAF514_12770 [Verrucomicrobiota bacterium]
MLCLTKLRGMTEPEKAMENLRVIRSLMEKATVYRAISGPAAFLGGVLALVLGGLGWTLAERPQSNGVFVISWVAALLVLSLINTFLLWRTANDRNEVLVSSGMKMALKAIVPPLLAGGVIGITWALGPEGNVVRCAAAWVLFYGLALLATSGFSPRSINWLGVAFTLTGMSLLAGACLAAEDLAPWLPIQVASLFMALTFGLFHLTYAFAVGIKLQPTTPDEA